MTIARIVFVTNDVFMKFLFVDMSVFQAIFVGARDSGSFVGAGDSGSFVGAGDSGS